MILAKRKWRKHLGRQYPAVEILVNNLGIFEPRAFEDIPDADWMCFFDVNVLSGVRLSRLYLPAMRKANWGRIIFISSESGVQIPTEMIHYGMTKTAMLAVSRGVDDFVDTLAKSSGQSFAEFEMAFFDKVRPTSWIRRFAMMDEVASMVTYVASSLASASTGAATRVEGGVIKSAF